MSNKSNNLPNPKLRKVYLKSIHTDTERYQVRNHDIVDWHVAALVKVLKDDTPLDPLYVNGASMSDMKPFEFGGIGSGRCLLPRSVNAGSKV